MLPQSVFSSLTSFSPVFPYAFSKFGWEVRCTFATRPFLFPGIITLYGTFLPFISHSPHLQLLVFWPNACINSSDRSDFEIEMMKVLAAIPNPFPSWKEGRKPQEALWVSQKQLVLMSSLDHYVVQHVDITITNLSHPLPDIFATSSNMPTCSEWFSLILVTALRQADRMRSLRFSYSCISRRTPRLSEWEAE